MFSYRTVHDEGRIAQDVQFRRYGAWMRLNAGPDTAEDWPVRLENSHPEVPSLHHTTLPVTAVPFSGGGLRISHAARPLNQRESHPPSRTHTPASAVRR